MQVRGERHKILGDFYFRGPTPILERAYVYGYAINYRINT